MRKLQKAMRPMSTVLLCPPQEKWLTLDYKGDD